MCVYQIFYLPSCWLVQLLLATEEGLGFGPFLYQKSEPPSLLLEHSVSRQCPPPPPPPLLHPPTHHLFCCLEYAILPISHFTIFYPPSSFFQNILPLFSLTLECSILLILQVVMQYQPPHPSPPPCFFSFQNMLSPLLVPINTKPFGGINQSVDRLLYGDTLHLQLFYLFS